MPWLGLVCPRWEQGLDERMQAWAAARAQGRDLKQKNTSSLKGFGFLRFGEPGLTQRMGGSMGARCAAEVLGLGVLGGVRWLGLVCPRWEQDLQQRMEAWAAACAAGEKLRFWGSWLCLCVAGLVCPRWEDGLQQRMEGWAAARAQGRDPKQVLRKGLGFCVLGSRG